MRETPHTETRAVAVELGRGALEPLRDRATSRRRRWLGAGVAALVLLLIAHAAGGWVGAGAIWANAFVVDDAPDALRYDVEVLAVADGSVTYRVHGTENNNVAERGTFGMVWPGGSAIVGDVVALDDALARRPLSVVSGTLVTGTMVDLVDSVWATDPLTAHGIAYEDVTFESELGPLAAWYVPGGSDSWVVIVHGKSTPRHESLRILPVIHRAGYHALVISYRGDPGAPSDPSGRYRYGLTEYRDLEAAIRYAISEGAQHLALVGFSMGAAIVITTLLDSPLAARVDAAVLDSPMLDLEACVDLASDGAELPFVRLPIPGTVLAASKWVAGWRYDVDWDAFDLLTRVGGLSTPILVFHGTDDDRVPIASSEAFARARPDLVQLELVVGAGHVMSWNLDPERYEAVVEAFLDDRLG